MLAKFAAKITTLDAALAGQPSSTDFLSARGDMHRESPAEARIHVRDEMGIAVAEARDGICTICHVRLRPQVLNTVRRNDAITQCDHCNRILFFVPTPAAASSAPDGVPQQAQ